LDKDHLRLKLTKFINSNDLTPLTACEQVFDSNTFLEKLFNFVGNYPSFSKALFNYHGSVPGLGQRIGRGEVLIWYLYDEVILGGASASTDIYIDGAPIIEVKSARRTGFRYTNFMLGIDEVEASFKFSYEVLKLFDKNARLGKLKLPTNFANVGKKKLEELKCISSAAYQRAEKKYFEDLIMGPVGQKTYVIFDAQTSLPVYYGKLKEKHLIIDRISGGLTRLSFDFS
jgi:hypothetical protein